MKLNYEKLYPGVVIGTTCMVSPLAAMIRATTAGFRNLFNPDVAAHIVCVCQNHGLFYGMEMAWPKIRRVDLDEIGKIVFVGSPIRADAVLLQDECNEFLWNSHSTAIRYDWKELFKFWDLPIYDSPRKLVCSDLAREMYKKAGVAYPKSWDDRCSPWDVQCHANGKL